MAGMPKGQREQSLLLICVVAIAAILLYWHLVFKPRSVELATKQERLEQLTAANERAKAEMAKGNLAELRRQLAEYEQNLALVRTLVPTGNEVPALLEQISTAARRVGLDIATVDPQPVVPGDGYDTYRYGLTVLGGYHELAEFLANVGSLTRIMLPVNLTLQLSTNASAQQLHGGPNKAVIEARFQVETFVARAVGSESAASAAAGGE